MRTKPTVLQDATIPIQGMTCASCVGRVRDALEDQPGVTAVAVDSVTREAKVSFDPEGTDIETLVAAIRKRGYGAEMPVVRTNLAEDQGAQETAPAGEYNELRYKARASGASKVCGCGDKAGRCHGRNPW